MSEHSSGQVPSSRKVGRGREQSTLAHVLSQSKLVEVASLTRRYMMRSVRDGTARANAQEGPRESVGVAD